MQGKSLIQSFNGKTSGEDEAIYNEHIGARYVRYKGWKLVSTASDTTWHLYRIDTDETELTDVAAENPEKVKELNAMWHAWANNNKVFPKPR
jgi:arylsulfatase